MWWLTRIAWVGMAVGGVLLVAGIVAGAVRAVDLAGIGVAYALGVGLICAFYGGTEPTFSDPTNVRNHWRGHLQVAAVLVVLGLLGGVIGSVT